ncbi:ankyrin [Mytilinidion resinicola]|uniref:Ankyrin n=1 Tax=Mytilinidion resinicola TaxID=574789 RepID=A0A6A6Z510_9PEZI|nr:ankyrin [Mytilinidion resinicola]KAF2815265.1 ankyrin [Mytilinidion resinicola]
MSNPENEYRPVETDHASPSIPPDTASPRSPTPENSSPNDPDRIEASNPHILALNNGLPDYSTTDPHGIQSIIQSASTGALELPITAYPTAMRHGHEADQSNICRDIVNSFFSAITSKKDEAVAMMIESNLVTANTTSIRGETPLLAAVRVENIRMVQELLDFDADVNAFGATPSEGYEEVIWDQPDPYPRAAIKGHKRTPLMVAAKKGNINLVKLLVDVYHADDALVAPDGELALRLASDNGHRDIVEFLPGRRGGGWRRWKAKHEKAMNRARKAVKKIYYFFKVVLYDIPRFFIWSCPKHLIVLPLKNSVVWCWKHRGEFGGWCKRRAKEMPKRIGRGAAKVWGGMKKVPARLWKAAKEIPRIFKAIAKWVWGIITGIPKALKVAALWLWDGVKSIAHGIGSILGRLASFLHTLLSAVMSFFRNITLKDIWNGFCSFLHATFVELPGKIWGWVLRFGEASYKVMKTIFGVVGEVIWWIITGLGWVVVYVPKKIWDILASCGESVSKAWIELLVWINPKR